MEKTRIAGKKCSCCHHLNWWKLEITWSPIHSTAGPYVWTQPASALLGSALWGTSPRQPSKVNKNRLLWRQKSSKQKCTGTNSCEMNAFWMAPVPLKKHVIPHHWLHIASTKTHGLHKPFTKLPWSLPWTLITFQWLKHPRIICELPGRIDDTIFISTSWFIELNVCPNISNPSGSQQAS